MGTRQYGAILIFPHIGLSAMIRGADNGSKFTVKDYSTEQVESILENYFAGFP